MGQPRCFCILRPPHFDKYLQIAPFLTQKYHINETNRIIVFFALKLRFLFLISYLPGSALFPLALNASTSFFASFTRGNTSEQNFVALAYNVNFFFSSVLLRNTPTIVFSHYACNGNKQPVLQQ